ncbi:MAG: hypothetical protein HW387_1289 [Parachlamydiales bacterium]|nr:hypothetical protein [Parachlamydiales bacterium]
MNQWHSLVTSLLKISKYKEQICLVERTLNRNGGKMNVLPYSTLTTLMFTIIMDVMGVGLVLPLLPNLVVSSTSPFYNGIDSLFSYGLVLAVWSLGGFFGSPFLGSFSDKIGRKKILIISLSCNALIYAFTAFAVLQKWFLLFILMRFSSGFFSGSFEIAQAAVADKR